MASSHFQKFQQIRSRSKLWSSPSAAEVRELPALPLESLRSVASAVIDPEHQRKSFEDILQSLKTNLLQAKRSAVLARSQSMEIQKRRDFCQEAMSCYQNAIGFRNQLRALTARMGFADRRRLRLVEGAPEWRTIRHAIAKSAELNQISFAA